MTHSQFTIPPDEIRINPKPIARLMGLDPENIPEPYDSLIKAEMEAIVNYQHIMGGYVISENIEIDKAGGTFVFNGERFNVGKQVVNKLGKSEMLAFFTCTAGEEVSLRSKKLMNSGDLLEGYIADLIGSILVEEAMDIVHKKLKTEMETQGLKTTNRYSPGYCDWKVDEQHILFRFFPSGFCGVKLTESALMSPIKSVSGVIGIGKEVRFHKYVCQACSNVNCIYRNLKYATTPKS